MSLRPRTLTLTLSLPHASLSHRVRIPARAHIAKRCAHEIEQFAQRHAVPVLYVDFTTQWRA